MEPNKGESKLPCNNPEGNKVGVTTLEQTAKGGQTIGNPNAHIMRSVHPVSNPNAQIGSGASYMASFGHFRNMMGSTYVNNNNSSNTYKVNEQQVKSIPITSNANANPSPPFQHNPPNNSKSEAKIVHTTIQSNSLTNNNISDIRSELHRGGVKGLYGAQNNQVPSTDASKFAIVNNAKPSPIAPIPVQSIPFQQMQSAPIPAFHPLPIHMMPVQPPVGHPVQAQAAFVNPIPVNPVPIQSAPVYLPVKPVPIQPAPVKPMPSQPYARALQAPVKQVAAMNQGLPQNDSNTVVYDAKKQITAGTNQNSMATAEAATKPVNSNQQLKSVSKAVNSIQQTKSTSETSLNDAKKRPIGQPEANPNQVKKMKPSKENLSIPPIPAKKIQSTEATSNTKPKTNKAKQAYSSTYHIAPDNNAETNSILDLVKLDNIPDVPPLPKLNSREIIELEKLLQFGDRYNTDPDDEWKADWSGNLQLVERDIVVNREKLIDRSQTKPVTKMFREVIADRARDGSMESFRGIRWLFSYIYYLQGTPPMARKIMAFSLYQPAKTAKERTEFIMKGIRRISYDPIVLQQDGWTTAKPRNPAVAVGGSVLVGRRVIWHRFEAIIIAYVRDEEIGDLWKAMWVEDHETFDLEADELQEAIKKWEAKETRRKARLITTSVTPIESAANSAASKKASGTRHSVTSTFNVEGIEHGIVLAMSYDENARPSIFWPARIMHVSEHHTLGVSGPPSRRNSPKNRIPIIFLAPFWNTQTIRKIDANTGPDIFSSGPLFHFESVEISNTTIKKYPYDGDNIKSLSIDNLRNEFKFLGLPKGAFNRFLDAHRLAISLKVYAQEEIRKTESNGRTTDHSSAYAALTDSHPMSVKTAIFPPVVLTLPYAYILSSLPAPVEQAAKLSSDEEITEPSIKLHKIVEAMEPPTSIGDNIHREIIPTSNDNISLSNAQGMQTPSRSPKAKIIDTPDISSSKDSSVIWSIEHFASSFLLSKIRTNTNNLDSSNGSSKILNYLETNLTCIITRLNEISAIHSSEETISLDQRKQRMRSFVDSCILIKTLGEDFLSSHCITINEKKPELIVEWRKTCERIYKCGISDLKVTGLGNGVTVVITDSRCNQHLTAVGSFERPVRIPAAIKGAKLAGCGSSEYFKFNTKVDDKYIDIAERKILPHAHQAKYLKRMKTKIAALPSNVRGHPLTDDSEGEGGEDTMGSRGSYTAAVIGVAAGLQAVDMVVTGECVNAFCAVRPPGHHAGRELRAMNAISNGFCLLNGAACAAIYATTPISDGGRGLKRACVIDFDVHHGNGTQDILCSTYDPRFLYVSLHAGGPHINGFDDDIFHHARRNSANKQEGIFPGRCGDTSPHPGVLNVPLGQRVTANLMGNALVSQVAPAVEAFSPDLIIISAGFDGHKNDPLGLGGLSAEDFGSITDVCCQMAAKICSGRLISILEGGYGVPCCRPKRDLFLPSSIKAKNFLGDELPQSMDDEVPVALQQKLDRCNAEGFLESVKEHVASLSKNNIQSRPKFK